MKHLLFFITCFFLVSCAREVVKNDLQQQYLKGEIKKVHTLSYVVEERFNQVEKSARTSERENTLVEYNSVGNQVERTLFSPTDKPTRRFFYQYDKKGNRALVNEYQENGSLKARYIYTHNANGMPSEVNTYSGEGVFLRKETRTYDSSQNLIEETTYNGKGEFEQKQVNTYDEEGRCIESNFYTNKGDLKLRYTYVYDNDNHLIERKKYDKDGKTLATHLYKYKLDKEKNWTERIEYINGKATYLTQREIEYGQGKKEERESLAQLDTSPERSSLSLLKNDWTAQGLKGAVKSLRVRTYDGANKQKDDGQNTLSVFTKKGYLSRISYYDKENLYMYEKTFAYQYNKEGGRMQGKMYFNDNDYLLTNYDENGDIKGGYLYQQNTQFPLEVSYNKEGKLSTYFLGETEIHYKYDRDLRLAEEKHKRGKEAWEVFYKYADNGSVIEEQIYKKGVLDEKKTFIYTFDEKGNWVERIEYKNRTPKEIIERVIEYY